MLLSEVKRVKEDEKQMNHFIKDEKRGISKLKI